MSLYLNVPYAEKDEAKALGARWNPKAKKWYVNCSREDYAKFSRWILNGQDMAHISLGDLYIVEGQRTCWKCGALMTIVGLGIDSFMWVYDGCHSEDGKPFCEFYEEEDELHLSWTPIEEDIPPKLLNYLKDNYHVKTGYSRTIGGYCFANHCSCCGAMQGNWFLFDEPDSPLSSCCPDEVELIGRMRKLKIKAIPVQDDLILDWEIGVCTGDFAYFKYGKVEDLFLTRNKSDEIISYEELYGLV